jgi:spore germination cell wall hydrolase CwlJ-like protein
MIRIIKTMLLALMLTATQVHADEQSDTTFLSLKDIECLARNIYYEAANEPEEGKVAVGMVTINRTESPKFPSTVCGVVAQKTVFSVPQVEVIEHKSLFKSTFENRTTWANVVVCQFSWTCKRVSRPKLDDPRWLESQRIAMELARGGFESLREKYANALHFHAVHVSPGWKLKKITRVGGHIFYE